MPSFAVILPAAGKSSRFGDRNYKKPFAPLDNKPVWLHSADRFLKRNDVKQFIVVIDPEDHDEFQAKFGANLAILGITLVHGGKERADSVANGLAAVDEGIEYIAVHDAARPCLADEWIDAVFAAAVKHSAAILATPVTSTLKRASAEQTIAETVSRDQLWAAQTPQVFRKDVLGQAYANRGDFVATDESQLVERSGVAVKLVPGSPINLKITSREDLRTASHLLKALPKPKSLGPVHPFEDDHLWR